MATQNSGNCLAAQFCLVPAWVLRNRAKSVMIVWKAPAMADTPKVREFVWNELVSNKPAECAVFYSKVFGWEARDVQLPGMGDYTIWTKDGETIAGMVHIQDEGTGEPVSFWGSYIAVEDVDATAQQIIQAGGSIKLLPVDVAEMGRIAIVSDPSGAIFSLITPVKPPV